MSVIQIVSEPIDTQSVLDSVADNRSGASILFLGTTREFTDGRQTASLDYECYHEMAISKLQELRDQACEKWTLTHCSIVHRIGHVPLGESSVAIAVSSPHRKAAFDAGQWIIDTLKEVVPIWKKENWADGTSDWVHPGVSD